MDHIDRLLTMSAVIAAHQGGWTLDELADWRATMGAIVDELIADGAHPIADDGDG